MDEETIGFLRFEGEDVKKGYLDARDAADALRAFDKSFRYFFERHVPELKGSGYEVPVLIRPGSWEILATMFVLTPIAVYLSTAAKTIAQNDFKDVGLKDVAQRTFEGMIWAIRLSKHLRNITARKFEGLKWRNNNSEVGIPNDKDEYLFIPKKYLDDYASAPPKLFSPIGKIISSKKSLVIGVNRNGETIKEHVTYEERWALTGEDNLLDEVVFPELKHGDNIAIKGEVTRGNELSNSLGIRYKNHVLTCYPQEGSIKRFKPFLFEEHVIHGFISRKDEHGGYAAKRPKIVIEFIEPINTASRTGDLLD